MKLPGMRLPVWLRKRVVVAALALLVVVGAFRLRVALSTFPSHSIARETEDVTGAGLSDGLGDRLPHRAVARLGSGRLRHGGRIGHLLFSPDGNRLASWGGEYRVSDGFAVWDVRTGKELRRGVLPGAWLDAWAWMPDGRLSAVLQTKAKDTEASLYDLSAAKLEGLALPEQDPRDDRRYAVSPAANLLALSRDARGGKGYTVRFLDLNPDRPAGELKVLRAAKGPLEYATVLRFTPNGRTSIAFTPPGATPQDPKWTAVLWDVETATELRRLRLADNAFHGSTIDASNEHLAAGFEDGSVILYELRTGFEVALAGRHKVEPRDAPFRSRGVIALRLSRDGKTLVTAGSDRTVRLWRIADGKSGLEMTWSHPPIEVMDISPDGAVLAVGGRDGIVRLFHTSTGAELCRQPGHQSALLSVGVSTDGRSAATTSRDRTIRVWDLENARELLMITCDGSLYGCTFAPDRKSLLGVVNQEDDPAHAALRIWNVTSGETIHTAGLTGTQAESVQFAPDGRTLFTVSGDTVTIRSWPQGERLRAIALRKDGEVGWPDASILAVSPDGGLLVTTVRNVTRLGSIAVDAWGGSLDMWDARSGKLVQRLASWGGTTERAAFTGTGELVLTSDEPIQGRRGESRLPQGALHVLEAETGRLKRVVPAPASPSALGLSSDGRPATTLAVSPDGRTVYLGRSEGTIHACEVATGGLRYALARHHGAVYDLAVVGAGRRLVSASQDASALVWDVSMPPATAPDRLDTAWDDLAATDASVAYRAMAVLAATPGRAIPFLAARLPMIRPEPALDLPTPERLREIRALELLESIAGAEAQNVLATIAKGDPAALRTQEAVASLRRLRGM